MSEPSATDRLETMVRQQIIERGITDSTLLDAMRAVPREQFFPAALQAEAFADRASGIGHGQTISQPYIVALMTQRLALESDMRVLEVGTGSGYQTAVLSELAAEVFSIERVKPLLDSAWERLGKLGVRNVHFRLGDGSAGLPDAAPFDRILITAGAPAIPEAMLRSQLRDGGIAVLPVGGTDQQVLICLQLRGRALVRSDICQCRFVPLVGEHGWPDAAAPVMGTPGT